MRSKIGASMKSAIAVCVTAMALYGTSADEIARVEEREAHANALIARLEREPDPIARVAYRGHRPFIELNGNLMDPLVNICKVGSICALCPS